MPLIRACLPRERATMAAIINDAAEAYRGVIPDDCWHEPYMPLAELEEEITAGVRFVGYESEGALIGVMGLRTVRDVDLIRHAYVLPSQQGKGIGGALLKHLRARTARRILIGTWAAADWAIRFYQGHGFALVAEPRKTELLNKYWTVSARQIETSVVLAAPPLPAA